MNFPSVVRSLLTIFTKETGPHWFSLILGPKNLLPDGWRFSTFLFMTARPFRAKVLKIRHLTRDIREMTLEMIEPSVLSFQPGQSVAVTVPDPSSGSSLLRYFSLASPPHSSKQLVLLLNSHDRGKGSTFLLENEIGASLEMSGPYGSFTCNMTWIVNYSLSEPERGLRRCGP